MSLRCVFAKGVLIALSLNLFANDERVGQPPLEEKIDRVSEQNLYCDWQGKSQSASVKSGLASEVSFLYWKARAEGLAYAQEIDATVPTQPLGTIDIQDVIKDIDSDWDPGFKLGLGYIFESRQQWQPKVYWTYFHSNTTASASTNPANIGLINLRPMWVPFLMGSITEKASAEWSLNYNVIDACIGRDFFVGKYLSLYPQAGIRGVWINQDYKVKYHGGYFANGGAVFLQRDNKMESSNDYSAGGVRFGSDAKWYLTKNLIIQGNGFVSLLYGEFEVREFYDGAFVQGVDLQPEDIYLKKDFNAVRPCLETELGATWQMFFNNDKFRLALGAFYQLVYWFDQVNIVNQSVSVDTNGNVYLSNLNPNGDLYMQGLRIQLNLDF